MKQNIFPADLMLIITVFFGAAFYGNGNYVVYMLTYIFSFVFLLCLTIFAASTILQKFYIKNVCRKSLRIGIEICCVNIYSL